MDLQCSLPRVNNIQIRRSGNSHCATLRAGKVRLGRTQVFFAIVDNSEDAEACAFYRNPHRSTRHASPKHPSERRSEGLRCGVRAYHHRRVPPPFGLLMQCGPIPFNMSAREAAERSPSQHVVLPRQTNFRMSVEAAETTIQNAYAAIVSDAERNRLIVADVIEAVRQGRTPLVPTGRTAS
jgi:hypothetical protein